MTALSGDARERLAAAVPGWVGLTHDEPLMLADALLPVVAELADLRAAEELESAARGVMAGATEVRGLPVAVTQALIVAASVIRARAAVLAPPATERTTP